MRKLILAATLAASPASAATVYDAGGWCRENCAIIGMQDGERFEATLAARPGEWSMLGRWLGEMTIDFHFPAVSFTQIDDIWLGGLGDGGLFSANSWEKVDGLSYVMWFEAAPAGAYMLGWMNISRVCDTCDEPWTRLDIAPVPLPAAGWLLLAGLGAIGALKLRRL